jgi:integrase
MDRVEKSRIKRSRSLIVRNVPTTEELRRILTHMPIQGRALFLMMASSGLRTSEALQVKTKDVELDKEPARMIIRGKFAMTRESRTAFISEEAKEVIEEWLKNRSEYLVAASKKSRPREHYKEEFKGKSLEDDRLFPFESNTAYAILKNAVRKSGLMTDVAPDRYTIRPHDFRRFFAIALAQKVPMRVVYELLGHKGHWVGFHTRPYTPEELAEFYIQGEPSLRIFTEAGEVGKLKAEVEQRNNELQTAINKLTLKNEELEEKVKTLINENKALQDKVNTLSDKIEEIRKNKCKPESHEGSS